MAGETAAAAWHGPIRTTRDQDHAISLFLPTSDPVAELGWHCKDLFPLHRPVYRRCGVEIRDTGRVGAVPADVGRSAPLKTAYTDCLELILLRRKEWGSLIAIAPDVINLPPQWTHGDCSARTEPDTDARDEEDASGKQCRVVP